jgi:hypothetical protein
VDYDEANNASVIDVTLHEGRNRQVRRMFDAVGYSVLALTRIRIGPIELKGLAPGTWRRLHPAEVHALLASADITAPALPQRPPDGTPAEREAPVGKASNARCAPSGAKPRTRAKGGREQKRKDAPAAPPPSPVSGAQERGNPASPHRRLKPEAPREPTPPDRGRPPHAPPSPLPKPSGKTAVPRGNSRSTDRPHAIEPTGKASTSRRDSRPTARPPAPKPVGRVAGPRGDTRPPQRQPAPKPAAPRGRAAGGQPDAAIAEAARELADRLRADDARDARQQPTYPPKVPAHAPNAPHYRKDRAKPRKRSG